MAANLGRSEILLGRDDPRPPVQSLRAGPLQLEFEGPDLRYVRAGGTEVLRRVYFALRDRDWNTIPAEVTRQVVEHGDDAFRIVTDARHRADGIDFHAMTILQGHSDGTIECTFDGTANVGFAYCRIGFCILHPVAMTAGRPFQAEGPTGAFRGEIPSDIGPQPEVAGCFLPLFDSFSALTIELPDGGEARFEFEGDLFEMEDQRNWTDGSFKTYSTPASLGTPFHATAGQAFHQRIRFRVVGGMLATGPTEARPHRLTIGERVAVLPPIGFGMSSVSDELSAREVGLLRTLRPAHLRADLHLGQSTWAANLDRAAAAATAVGCALELAVFVDDQAEAELAALTDALPGLPPVARVLVLHEAEAPLASTSAKWMTLARAGLGDVLPGVPLAGGTTGNFAEVNRGRPDPATYDQLAYAITPQVHLFDERSLVEGIDAQGDTVRTAATFMGGRPIVIVSVTLKPPFNQAASAQGSAATRAGDLPPEVDPRQPSLFAAAWTIGSVRSLAAAGAASLTYYETVGWRGLIESAAGAPAGAFPSRPDMVFPVYHAFRWLADGTDGDVLATVSDHPLELDGLALRIDGVLRVIVANLTPDSRRCRIGPLEMSTLTIRRLNADTARQAMWEPDTLELSPSQVAVRDGMVDLELDAYEVVRLDEGLASR